MNIEKDTDIKSIRKALQKTDAEKLRRSQQRKDYLEKIASMHTGKNIYVQISGDMAYVDIAERDSHMGYTDRLILNVPAEIPDQVQTNLDDEAWDLLFQKMEMYHELGHIFYTDWPSFEDMIFGDGAQWGVPMKMRSMFKDWWNYAEDATIEPLLAKRFDIEDDLAAKNHNLLSAHKPEGEIPMREAINLALLMEKYDMGWVDELTDANSNELRFTHSRDRELFKKDALPIIDDMMPDIKSESDPVERNILIYEMYQELSDVVLDASDAGVKLESGDYAPDDAERRGDESEGDEFEDDDEAAGQKQSDESGSEGGIALIPVAGNVDHDIQRDYNDQLKQEQDAVDAPDRADDAEDWARIIDYDYDIDSELKLSLPEDPLELGSYSDATRMEAERMSEPLARELRQRLKHEQRTKKKANQRSGKVDANRLYKTEQGNVNIFKQTDEPEEKDYSCIIVLDRSGSMGHNGPDMMPEVEEASGALAYALEDIGVDVGQISLTRGVPTLEKSLSESVEDGKKPMFRGFSGGGTPLSDGLFLAKERLEDKGGHPFIIIITDGQPDHRERYRDILHSCNFPVLGIYVSASGDFNTGHMNESSYFHQLVYSKYDEALDAARKLTKQVMF